MTEPKRLTPEELAEALQRSRQWMHDGFRHHLTSIKDHIAALEAELAEAKRQAERGKEAREVVQDMVDECPSLAEDVGGIEANWRGYFVSYDSFISAIGAAWPDGDPGYTQDPFEYIVKLIDERDEARNELAAKETSRRLATSVSHHCPSCGGWHEYVAVCPNNGREIDWERSAKHGS